MADKYIFKSTGNYVSSTVNCTYRGLNGIQISAIYKLEDYTIRVNFQFPKVKEHKSDLLSFIPKNWIISSGKVELIKNIEAENGRIISIIDGVPTQYENKNIKKTSIHKEKEYRRNKNFMISYEQHNKLSKEN